MGRQLYTHANLTKLSKTIGFTQINEAIETERCGADLLYCLFRRPSVAVPRLLPPLLELIRKKYNPELEDSRIFCDAVTFLTTRGNDIDPRIQIFYILLIINNEEEAQNAIRSAYVCQSPGNLWGPNPGLHLATFLQDLAQLFGSLFSGSFGEANIVRSIHDFVKFAEKFYMSK